MCASLQVAQAESKVLWDAWYKITVDGQPYGYSHDRVEKDGATYNYTNEVMTKDSSGNSIENVGVVSEGKMGLIAKKFNFLGDYGSKKVSINAIYPKDNVFEATVVEDGKSTKVPSTSFVSGEGRTIPSLLFPLWIKAFETDLSSGKTKSLFVILEGGLPRPEGGKTFSPVSAEVKEIKAKTGKAYKIKLEDQEQLWSVDASGKPLVIESPSFHRRMEIATEAEAKKMFAK